MPPPRRIRFGPFTFDAAAGELWLDGARVPLQPQPSRLLAMLLEHPGEVVTRDAIRAALWGDDVHVDFDRSLNFCVARLRSALGDNAAAPRFIETLPTRGYRLAKAAVPAEQATEDATEYATEYAEYAEATEHATEYAEYAEYADQKTTTGTGPLRRAVVVVSLAVAAVIALRILSPWDASLPKIVVVPFQNETGSPGLDRVAKGVSDATVVKLAESDRLRVIGNAAGLRLSFRPPDMKAMGESLGAQYLVLGQMKRDNQRMRIVAHLIRVTDQTHVWAKTYDTDALDLPDQASIGSAIAAAVVARFAR